MTHIITTYYYYVGHPCNRLAMNNSCAEYELPEWFIDEIGGVTTREKTTNILALISYIILHTAVNTPTRDTSASNQNRTLLHLINTGHAIETTVMSHTNPTQGVAVLLLIATMSVVVHACSPPVDWVSATAAEQSFLAVGWHCCTPAYTFMRVVHSTDWFIWCI